MNRLARILTLWAICLFASAVAQVGLVFVDAFREPSSALRPIYDDPQSGDAPFGWAQSAGWIRTEYWIRPTLRDTGPIHGKPVGGTAKGSNWIDDYARKTLPVANMAVSVRASNYIYLRQSGWPMRCVECEWQSIRWVSGSDPWGETGFLLDSDRKPLAWNSDASVFPLRAIPLGCAVNLLVGMCAFRLALAAWLRWSPFERAARRSAAGVCGRCAYPRAGLPTRSACPECGERATAAPRRSAGHAFVRGFATALATLLLTAVAAYGPLVPVLKARECLSKFEGWGWTTSDRFLDVELEGEPRVCHVFREELGWPIPLVFREVRRLDPSKTFYSAELGPSEDAWTEGLQISRDPFGQPPLPIRPIMPNVLIVLGLAWGVVNLTAPLLGWVVGLARPRARAATAGAS